MRAISQNSTGKARGLSAYRRQWARSGAVLLAVLLAAGGCKTLRLNSETDSGSESLRLVGLTNGTILHSEVTLPFKARPDKFDGVYFVVNDGHSPMGVEIETNSAGCGVVRWRTESFENGRYDVYLEAEVGERTFFGPTNSLVVSNLISFDSWPVCGTRMWVFARLAVPHADWKVKVFDERRKYLGNFVGSTTNGLINFIWDLTSTTGSPFTNENSFNLAFSYVAIGGSKAIIPRIHPNPMVSPSIDTDPTPWKLRPPD